MKHLWRKWLHGAERCVCGVSRGHDAVGLFYGIPSDGPRRDFTRTCPPCLRKLNPRPEVKRA